MSDVGGGDADGVAAEGELPVWLTEAILSQGPPPDAVDLVKASLTWRTVDAELLALSYDSVLDVAGVRDAAAARTMEFVLGDTSVLIEVDHGSITGRVIPAQAGDVSAETLSSSKTLGSSETQGQSFDTPIDASGSFVLRDLPAGTVRLVIRTESGRWTTGSFSVG